MNILLFVALLGALFAGIHMIAQPRAYVGRGPIPAQSVGNVRAMGIFFVGTSGLLVVFFLVPFLLFKI